MAETLETNTEQKPADVVPEEKPQSDDKKTEESTEEEKEETEVNDNEENAEDDGSFEEELGLLERPVEIISRKRDRKSTTRFSLDSSNEAKKIPEDELDYTKGKGVKLGDIEFVKYQLDKTLSDELKPMHRLLYHRQGKSIMLKKNIRAFCGFPFEKDSNHYQRMIVQLDKFVMGGLRFVSGIFGLEKKGDKDQLKEKIIEFLMAPKDLEKPIPKSKKLKKKSKGKKKKSKKAAKSDKERSSKKSSSSSAKEDDEVSSASDDSDDDEEEEEEEEKPKPHKKKKTDSPKKKETKKKKPTPVKISVPKKKSKKETKDTPKKSKADAKRKVVDDSDDDEPLVKKSKTEPTDRDIKEVVTEILKDANLEEVTMKTVCKQVYERFPDFDLTGRKDFIKNTVKEIIS